MSDRNDNSSLQGMFAQVLRDIQTGINRLEQSVNQANQPAPAQPQQQPGGFSTPPFEESMQSQPQPTQPQPAPKPVEPYTGAKWEYKVVYVNFRGQISSEGEQTIIGRGERRSSFVRDYLDELGQQGWDLAGVSPLGETENSYFVFKRPSTGDHPAASTATRNGQRVQVEEVDEGGNPVAQL